MTLEELMSVLDVDNLTFTILDRNGVAIRKEQTYNSSLDFFLENGSRDIAEINPKRLLNLTIKLRN